MTPPDMTRRRILGLAGLGLGGTLLAACSSGSTTTGRPAGASGSQTAAAASSSGSAPSSSASSTSAAPVGKPVRTWLYQADGATYGVGMPIIAYMSAEITDASAFAAATTVTVNGKPVAGSWNFRTSSIYAGYPVEAHYRPMTYWPAHSTIKLDLPIKNIAAGTGLYFRADLTLTMKTGARNITTVDGKTLRMVVTSDGRKKFSFPVSLGSADTPTYDGVKIVMDRNRIERMVNTVPGESYDLQVPWSVRLTNSGEFIHSASWNTGNIGRRSTSHGCTNLDVEAAEKYFRFANVGDVTTYTNTGGRTMPTWDGYGDWNMPWSQWIKGGSVAL